MSFTVLRETWNTYGETDPLWAILTDPEKKNGNWDVAEFFRTGLGDVREKMFRPIEALNFPLRRGRALDFGCGVGRLTQALCETFQECHGVDIAAAMIERARAYNRHGERCHYHVNAAPDLRLFPDAHFDFIGTFIVLQHMEPQYSRRYLEEFVRVLAPGGLLFFQIPAAYYPPEPPPPPPPLPQAGFRARVAVEPTSLVLRPGDPFTLRVAVENTSPCPWQKLNVGNHWFTESGETIILGQSRMYLPPLVPPGGEFVGAFPLNAPSAPGRYLLEIDVVQELVAWFKDKGSQSVRVPCTVLPARGWVSKQTRRLLRWAKALLQPRPRPQPTPPPSAPARKELMMEMHCTPREAIESLLARCGAQLVACKDDGSCGDRFLSYCYWVTK
jgi:SAM-dependent methyltransferase